MSERQYFFQFLSFFRSLMIFVFLIENEYDYNLTFFFLSGSVLLLKFAVNDFTCSSLLFGFWLTIFRYSAGVAYFYWWFMWPFCDYCLLLRSSKSVSWSGGGGGMGDPPCFKIVYSEPRRVSHPSRERLGSFRHWYSIRIGWRGFRVSRARFWLAADKILDLG